jgi:8-oxo-dGTP pyrophosphatase MutT (NUDIX family)
MCVLHQSGREVEVLMVRRSATARFMAGAWVFPGGVVDAADDGAAARAAVPDMARPDLRPALAAAFREVVEETGIWITDEPFVELPAGGVFAIAQQRGIRFAAPRTAYFANWITPTMVPVRFDAHFFIADLAARVAPQPDQHEIDAAEYVTPAEALRRATAGDWLVPFPTQRILEQLADVASVAAALEKWRHAPVVPVQPRMEVKADGSFRVVMPDDPGFADLADLPPDPDLLAQAAAVAAKQGRPIAEVPHEH